VLNVGTIPPQVMAHLFEPFQGGRRQPGQNQGLGLGLYIVQQIVQVHQGSVDVQSGIDGNTIFRVKVPRKITKR
jgi:two-component system, sensor histidine kinase and response regulator